MKLEGRNLHSFELELTEKLFADSIVRRSPAKIISRSLAGTFSEEFKQLTAVGTYSPKKEYEYLYNRFTASSYGVRANFIIGISRRPSRSYWRKEAYYNWNRRCNISLL